MRVYYSENEHEWSRSQGTHYGGKVKMSCKEYNEMNAKSRIGRIGYIGDAYRDFAFAKSKRQILFTKIPGALEMAYILGINYRRENYCIEIID